MKPKNKKPTKKTRNPKNPKTCQSPGEGTLPLPTLLARADRRAEADLVLGFALFALFFAFVVVFCCFFRCCFFHFCEFASMDRSSAGGNPIRLTQDLVGGGCSLHKWSESPLQGDTPLLINQGFIHAGNSRSNRSDGYVAAGFHFEFNPGMAGFPKRKTPGFQSTLGHSKSGTLVGGGSNIEKPQNGLPW